MKPEDLLLINSLVEPVIMYPKVNYVIYNAAAYIVQDNLIVPEGGITWRPTLTYELIA